MKLLVVRHGVAMDRADYQLAARSASGASLANDDFRPLTLDGIRKMKKNAEGLKKLVGRPDHLVSSPLTRAHQTAEILRAEWEGLEIETCEYLRQDSKYPAFAGWLNKLVGSENEDALVVITGHEMHLSRLVGWFMKGTATGLQQSSMLELKKGGACLLDFPEAFAKGQGILKWLATPAMLRALR